MSALRQILRPLASLRLTVVLMALSMFLVLAGTLAQTNMGIWTVVDRYFRSLVVWIEFQMFVPRELLRVPGAILFPGGATLGALLLVNVVAAHAVRFKLNWKRSGIIITHVGIILLLVGEAVTGIAADEGNMTIHEGASSNYIEDLRSSELAIIDSSTSDDDLVVVVPDSKLSSARIPISHGLLPFDIEVNQWMPNSHAFGPQQASPEQLSKADSGLGTQVAAVPAPPATGVDGAVTDAPSAYITLWRDGQRLGSYLVSVYLQQLQPIVVEGKSYDIALRFKRTYKPYTLHLIDFRHDKFVGTELPRNFSSQVRLVDEARNVDREVLIYMNHPLRYAGETFYQASFLQGDSGTVLQVVRNPGWLIPYISCSLVTLGMLLHFGMRLSAFSRRQSR